MRPFRGALTALAVLLLLSWKAPNIINSAEGLPTRDPPDRPGIHSSRAPWVRRQIAGLQRLAVQRLAEVFDNVVSILQSYGQADEIRRNTRLKQLLVGQLAMGV